MKKNLQIVILMLTLLLSLNACSTIVPGKIVYSDEIEGTIEELKAKGIHIKANILVSDTGQLLFYDASGKRLEPCVLPVPGAKGETAKKEASASQAGEKVCQGMTTGSAVTEIQALPILKTNSGNCMTFGPDASGAHYQFCW